MIRRPALRLLVLVGLGILLCAGSGCCRRMQCSDCGCVTLHKPVANCCDTTCGDCCDGCPSILHHLFGYLLCGKSECCTSCPTCVGPSCCDLPWVTANASPAPAQAPAQPKGELILSMPSEIPGGEASEEHSPRSQPLPRPVDLSGPPAPGAPVARKAQPELTLIKTGPAQTHVGKTVEHVMEVHNTGPVAATEVKLVDHLPPELKLEEPPAGAVVTRDAEVHWNLGAIAPEDSRRVTIRTRAIAVTPRAVNQAVVTSKEGSGATATAELAVIGSSAMLLEVYDLADPVQEGEDTEYLLRVTNQGSLTAHDLHLVADCPLALTPVMVNGDVTGMQGQTVNLPLFNLEPKSSRTFRLKVKAVSAGDARLKVTLTSRELDGPVVEEESTTVYATK